LIWLILLVILLGAVLVGGGGYTYRTYWGPQGSTVAEDRGSPAGAVAVLVVAVLFLIGLIYFGSTAGWYNSQPGNTVVNNSYSTFMPNTSAPFTSAPTSTAPPISP
jgi:hypothetical protein